MNHNGRDFRPRYRETAVNTIAVTTRTLSGKPIRYGNILVLRLVNANFIRSLTMPSTRTCTESNGHTSVLDVIRARVYLLVA
jgi:hypothetical protein